jgi:hypothetical protein
MGEYDLHKELINAVAQYRLLAEMFSQDPDNLSQINQLVAELEQDLRNVELSAEAAKYDKRWQAARWRHPASRGSHNYPATAVRLLFYAFDLLFLEGFDLRKAPQIERKRILKMLFDETGLESPILNSEHLLTNGGEMFAHACKLNFEASSQRKQTRRIGRSEVKGGDGMVPHRLQQNPQTARHGGQP